MLNKLEVERQAKAFAYEISAYIRSKYFSDYLLEVVRLDWNPKRRSSRGGIYAKGPGINIAMKSEFLLDKVPVNRFYEYASYNNNTIIGGFYYTKPLLKLKTIVAHEMAHTAQFYEYKKLDYRCKPHGPTFKKFYKDFRLQFINQHVENQDLLIKDYTADLEYLFTGR